MAKDFYPQMPFISYIPFLHFMEGEKEPKKRKAVLFYFHHGHLVEEIDEINSELEKAKCRPMTREELAELLRMQEGILEQIEFLNYILATDPSDIEEYQGKKVFPAIDAGDGNKEVGEMKITQLIIEHFIPGHAGCYVAAVKKE